MGRGLCSFDARQGMDTTLLTGYARCSTDEQDLTAQRHALLALGVPAERIYTDKGLTGTHRNRPGLDQALASVRAGDALVVPKLDRLARSVPDARAIGDSLIARGVKLRVGGIVYDPADPMGKMFFNILATFAEFEVDLLRLRTKEGMAIAKANGRLKGKPPSSTHASRPTWSNCTSRAATASPSWLTCSPYHGQPSTVCWTKHVTTAPHDRSPMAATNGRPINPKVTPGSPPSPNRRPRRQGFLIRGAHLRTSEGRCVATNLGLAPCSGTRRRIGLRTRLCPGRRRDDPSGRGHRPPCGPMSCPPMPSVGYPARPLRRPGTKHRPRRPCPAVSVGPGVASPEARTTAGGERDVRDRRMVLRQYASLWHCGRSGVWPLPVAHRK